ncbi:unnamed protein product [Chironomus riparius]|uniref:Uncharacterized protein n=1 Tax=Chironomus riparius TaxID=315576 RepID=A0A9N9WYT4_9DIPT|nr:unnamed protein product [Chironomus riparius]
MKVLLILICIMQMTTITWTLTVTCDYKQDDFIILMNKYKCEVKKDFKITSKNSTLITKTIGSHKSRKSNDDVAVFSIKKYTVNYFPTGLQKHFQNLEGIVINFCSLKEVHQDNLKIFPNLTYLDLNDNDIEVIEAETFKNNQKLKLIWLKRNKIYHIDLNAFIGPTELTNLIMVENKCTNSKGTNADDVKKVIETLNCTSQEYLAKKNNEPVAEKIEQQMLKNESLVSNDSQSTSNLNFLVSSIEKLINEKLNENFNKTQELLTNLGLKVDKTEQDLTEIKNQVAELYKINSKSSNDMLSRLDLIQQTQSQLISNCTTKYEPSSNITLADLKDTLNAMQESQNNNTKKLQDPINSQNSPQLSNLTQSIATITEDLEEVKRTLSNTQTYVVETIQTYADNNTSELTKVKQNIEGTEKKIMSSVQAELKALKSDLEKVRKNSQNKYNFPILTTIPTTTKASTDKDPEIIEDVTTLDELTIVTNDTTTQSVDNNVTLTTVNEDKDSNQDKTNSSTQPPEIEESSTTEAIGNLTIQAADSQNASLTNSTENITSSTIQVAEIANESSKQTAENSTTQEDSKAQVDLTAEPADNVNRLTDIPANNEVDSLPKFMENSTEQPVNNVEEPTTLKDATDHIITPQTAVNINNSSTQAIINTNEDPEGSTSAEIESNSENPTVQQETTIESSANKTADAPLLSKDDEVKA